MKKIQTFLRNHFNLYTSTFLTLWWYQWWSCWWYWWYTIVALQWLCLEAIGSFWKKLEAFESHWKLLGAMGSFWKLWEAFGSYWKLLIGSFQKQARRGTWRTDSGPCQYFKSFNGDSLQRIFQCNPASDTHGISAQTVYKRSRRSFVPRSQNWRGYDARHDTCQNVYTSTLCTCHILPESA